MTLAHFARRLLAQIAGSRASSRRQICARGGAVGQLPRRRLLMQAGAELASLVEAFPRERLRLRSRNVLPTCHCADKRGSRLSTALAPLWPTL
jgi:hypothetical protein